MFPFVLLLVVGARAALPMPNTSAPPPAVSDLVSIPFPSADGPLAVRHVSGTYASTGRSYKASVASLNAVGRLAIGLPAGGCTQHVNVTTSAATCNCEWATNGGFFAFTPPACIGNIIVDGKIEQIQPSASVNIGMTAANTTVVGFLSEEDATKNTHGFRQLISGSGWLVRGGASYVKHSGDIDPHGSFATEKAPRTGLAVMANGTVLSVAVDGIESTKAGPDLFEFAELLVLLGAQEAINLDGGGSTTAVYHDQIYNRPTCHDTPMPICERNVTSIVCIRAAT